MAVDGEASGESCLESRTKIIPFLYTAEVLAKVHEQDLRTNVAIL